MRFGRGGTRPLIGDTGFAPAEQGAAGNNLPANTGVWQPYHSQPGAMQPGRQSPVTGNMGGNDGYWGSDPRAAEIQPYPRRPIPNPNEGRPHIVGSNGFNDKFWVADRHAYWDTGTSRTNSHPGIFGNPPNPQYDGPPTPELRTINRSLSFQLGSDATGAQDNLARPYTWVGQQDGSWSSVYGGVPGLYQPYGTRGGYPYPIVSPVQEGSAGDGPQRVYAGPPHGLHSVTIGGRWQTNQVYRARPQQRPVRYDRPSNSPQAGQSYSQTVVPQGGTGTGASRGGRVGLSARIGGRGWSGT